MTTRDTKPFGRVFWHNSPHIPSSPARESNAPPVGTTPADEHHEPRVARQTCSHCGATYTICPGCGASVHYDPRNYGDHCPRYPCLFSNHPRARQGFTPTEFT